MSAARGLLRWFWRSQSPNPPSEIDNTCTYVVKDPATRPGQTERWPTKHADDVYLYIIDWSVYAASDPIVSSTWTTDLGLVLWQEDFTDVLARVLVGQGLNRRVYSLVNTVTLASSAEYTQTVKIIIDNKVCAPRPTYGPSGAELACL